MSSRRAVLADFQWELIASFMPNSAGRRRPVKDHRLVVEGIACRYRVGNPRRDRPERFGSRKTVWKRHRRYAGDETWDSVLAILLGRAQNRGMIGWKVSVNFLVNRAHQHGTNIPRHTVGPAG